MFYKSEILKNAVSERWYSDRSGTLAVRDSSFKLFEIHVEVVNKTLKYFDFSR